MLNKKRLALYKTWTGLDWTEFLLSQAHARITLLQSMHMCVFVHP